MIQPTEHYARARLPLMAFAALALLVGVLAGLVRLGWSIPIALLPSPISHGALMVSGFLGTLIALERAVALGRGWPYLAPLLSGVGGVLVLAGAAAIGLSLITLGSVAAVAVLAFIFRLQPALFTAAMGLGALSWAVGNSLLLLNAPLYQATPWWMGFVVLTVAGERLELGRVFPASKRRQPLFAALVGLFLLGVLLSLADFDGGMRLVGAAFVLLALWLLRYDAARRTIRHPGLTRFMAVSILSGYLWLAAAGLLALIFGGVRAGFVYDALVHALFLGFTFAMIFAHAPIIIPAILNRPVTYSSLFYGHLALLHASLLLRVTGDLAAWLPGRQWGGLLNAAALAFFALNTLLAARTGRREHGDAP